METMQAIIDNCKKVKNEKGYTYKYYQPANGSDATDDDRIAAMRQAVNNGAKAEFDSSASEISNALHTDFTALQVANAVKYIEGVTSAKVVREAVGKNGLRSEKLYTAYAIA